MALVECDFIWKALIERVNGKKYVWKVAHRAVAGHILVMVLVPPGEEGVQPLCMITIQGASQKPSKGTTSHFCIHKSPLNELLCAVTVTVTGDAFKGQTGCKFTGHSSLLAGPASTESKPTAQKLCTKTRQGTKQKFQVYASSSNSKCVSATSKHTSLVDVASCTLAQLRSGVHFQAYRPGMRCRYNRNTCQA